MHERPRRLRLQIKIWYKKPAKVTPSAGDIASQVHFNRLRFEERRQLFESRGGVATAPRTSNNVNSDRTNKGRTDNTINAASQPPREVSVNHESTNARPCFAYQVLRTVPSISFTMVNTVSTKKVRKNPALVAFSGFVLV